MFADVCPGTDGVFLILAVDDFAHAADEQAIFILGKEGIPGGAPDDFDTFQPAPRKALPVPG